jgi:hypothetical protein
MPCEFPMIVYEKESAKKPNGIPDQFSFGTLRMTKRKLSGMTAIGVCSWIPAFAGMTLLGALER